MYSSKNPEKLENFTIIDICVFCIYIFRNPEKLENLCLGLGALVAGLVLCVGV